MLLPLNLIIESLQSFNPLLYLAEETPFSFSAIKVLSLDDAGSLERDVLYISHPRTLRKLPRADYTGHFFVFPAKSSATDRYKGFINAIVLDETVAPGAIVNCLHELFRESETLEMQMQIAVRSEDAYSAMMEVARKMFPDSVLIVVDSAYNIIAATHDGTPMNKDIDRLLKQGFYDKAYLQKLLAYGYFDQGDRYLTPRLSPQPNVAGYPMLIRSFHNTGIFYSFVTCYFLKDQPSLLTQYYFSVFTDLLDYFFRYSGFYQNAIPKKQQMLEDILSSGQLSPDLVQERCRELGLPPFGEFRLGFIEYENGSPIKLDHMATQLRTWCQVKNYGVFLYRSSIIILFKDWHSYSSTEHEVLLQSWSDMMNILSNSRARIGISLLFTSIADIRAAYLQARSAIRVGARLQPNQKQYQYSRYFVYDLLEEYQPKIPLETVYTQYLNKLIADADSENSNLRLLYHFINSERNISTTAQKVHMHRNSVIYRLQKINDSLRLDLNDPEMRLRLLLSFKILELLGKLPSDFLSDSIIADSIASQGEDGMLPE